MRSKALTLTMLSGSAVVVVGLLVWMFAGQSVAFGAEGDQPAGQVAARSTEPAVRTRTSGMMRWRRAYLGRLAENLKMDETQKSKYAQLLKKHEEEMQRILELQRKEEERFAKVLKQMLTPQQKEQYDQLQQRRQSMADRFRRRWGANLADLTPQAVKQAMAQMDVTGQQRKEVLKLIKKAQKEMRNRRGPQQSEGGDDVRLQLQEILGRDKTRQLLREVRRLSGRGDWGPDRRMMRGGWGADREGRRGSSPHGQP